MSFCLLLIFFTTHTIYFFDFFYFLSPPLFLFLFYVWGCSSYGRAFALHARGTGIDTPHLHYSFQKKIYTTLLFFFLLLLITTLDFLILYSILIYFTLYYSIYIFTTLYIFFYYPSLFSFLKKRQRQGSNLRSQREIA